MSSKKKKHAKINVIMQKSHIMDILHQNSLTKKSLLKYYDIQEKIKIQFYISFIFAVYLIIF